jgi:hypothetical protein
MYADPRRVRKHRITLNFDDYENAVIEALANYQGDEKAAVLRVMVLREACSSLNIADPNEMQVTA